jgi:hypothetical protein
MKRAALLSLVVASALMLGGCAAAAPEQDTGTDVAMPQADDLDNRTDVSCTPGEELLLNTPSTLYTVSGPCENVVIEGSDLIVRLEQVESLVVRGDRVSVEAQSIRSLTIIGNHNSVVTEVEVNDPTLNGDDNELS